MAVNSYCVISWTFFVRMHKENVLNSREKQRRVDLPCSELVMNNGGGGGCGLLHACCLCGVSSNSAALQLSTSHVQTSSPADAQYTGRCRGQSAIPSLSLSSRNLRFKILIKTDKQFREQYSIPGAISFSLTHWLGTRVWYVLLWVSHLQPNFT